MKNTWIFVTSIKDYPKIDTDWNAKLATKHWTVLTTNSAHKALLDSAEGDRVYIYLAKVGFIARGEITGPAVPVVDKTGWSPEKVQKLRDKKQVPIKFDRWLGRAKVISIADLKADNDAGQTTFARFQNGTNFLQSPEDADAINALWDKRTMPAM